MRRSLFPVIALLAAAVIAGSCSGENGGGARQARASRESGEGETFVLPVETTPAERGDIATAYRSTTTLESQRQVTMTARVTGIVDAIHVQEGDRVERGQVLLELQAEEYRIDLEKAAARLEKATRDFDRVKNMRESNLLSTEEYDAKKYEFDLSRAENEQAALTLSHTRVTAPFSGQVVRRLVEVGQLVNPAEELFEVADLEPLRAFVHVPSREMRNIEVGQPARLVLDSDDTVIRGTITLISPVVDVATGTVRVTLEIPDYPPGVRPGDFAEVEIITDVHAATILVPREAVLEEGDDRHVYVVEADTVRRQTVEIGYENDRQMEILSGLAAGDAVVVSGQNSLREGDPVEVLSAPGETSSGDGP